MPLSMRKLPVGIQTFSGIRRDKYLYVDKTALVWKVATTGKPYLADGRELVKVGVEFSSEERNIGRWLVS